ncbi:insulinase family protein [uncultured Roseivirga sp.]|uniref:M16 family metallopeptidase n=1 Tax=uncultured Roseivirga sp. TaxID=543088 RepID=UPI0030DD1F22
MTQRLQKLSIWAVLLLVLPLSSFAFQQLEKDPSVKIGKLENGFTYYLRQNAKPENRIEFRLAVNAGSILEDDDQQGLAHFTEHMLFNGTKNFEKNELISFLQKMGLEFGGDLNAYTSFDETVYFLPIPTEDKENIDKALTVLSDWAHNATFDNEEIDKERGVVMEEWRLGRGASQRMREETWPVVLQGSRYAERLPIGKETVLQNFKYDAAKRYYRDWYRPDLMAIVAVGDFDLAEMEAKIKSYFGSMENPKKPKERKYYDLPPFKGTRIAVATDDEATGSSIAVGFITPGTHKPENTLEDFRKSILNGLYGQMINQRLREKLQSENPPYLFSFSGYGGSLGKHKKEYSIVVNVKDDMFKEGLKAAMVENERVRRYGFTNVELERVKALYLNSYDRRAKEADKAQSGSLVNTYVQHFLNGGTLLSEKQMLDLVNQILPTIKVEEINELVKGWITEDNQTIVITAKTDQEANIPSENELKAIMKDVRTDESIEPYVEEKLATTLMTSAPKPGKITGESTNEPTGITKLTLSNGATVYIKPTDFKNDEVRMSAYSDGGVSLYSADEFIDLTNASQVIAELGLGEFSQVDLGKFMTGKTASVGASIGQYEESMSGFSSLKDLETFFQMVHLKFTTVRYDEQAFKSWVTRMKTLYSNFGSSPDIKYQLESQKIMFGDNPWVGGLPTAEEMDQISLKRVTDIYKERFADASDFSFVFVGNIDMKTFKPLLEKYIASLPATHKKESSKDLNLRPLPGVITQNVYAGVDDKSVVTITLSGDYNYTLDNNGLMNAAASILTNKMIETLREELGGVYGVSARASMSENPKETFTFTISFPCKPDNAEALAEAAMKELEKLKNGEFTEEDLQKVITARMQNFDEQIKTNAYWQGMIKSYSKSGDGFEEILKSNERAKAITKEQVVKAVNQYLTGENIIRITKLPDGYKGDTNLKQEIKKN